MLEIQVLCISKQGHTEGTTLISTATHNRANEREYKTS